MMPSLKKWIKKTGLLWWIPQKVSSNFSYNSLFISMEKLFQFKEFAINQDRCAMKIGTDSVLLGAWTSVETFPNSILDIGAGTGVLALMLAQRSNAELIDAIEIDDAAYEQFVENFETSPWRVRL